MVNNSGYTFTREGIDLIEKIAELRGKPLSETIEHLNIELDNFVRDYLMQELKCEQARVGLWDRLQAEKKAGKE